MTRRYATHLAVVGHTLAFLAGRPFVTLAQQADAALLAADSSFVRAVAQPDPATLTPLIDSEVTWTNAAGETLARADLGRTVPRPAIAHEARATTKRFQYGRVGVVQVDEGKLHTLRIWVQRPAGWRLLIYQEVRSLDQPATTAPTAAHDCDNPCRRIPYEPRSANERAVIAAYQGLETAAVQADATNWGKFVADEFILVSSNGDRTFDKPTRLEGVRRSTYGGVSPTELLTATMFDFETVVVMRSRHRPTKGNDLQIARVWVNRGGTWMSTLSYQTAIRGASPQ